MAWICVVAVGLLGPPTEVTTALPSRIRAQRGRSAVTPSSLRKRAAQLASASALAPLLETVLRPPARVMRNCVHDLGPR